MSSSSGRNTARLAEESDNVIPFDRQGARRVIQPAALLRDERAVVALVTVTRFIGDDRVHAQVPIFADEIHSPDMTRADLKLRPELSELLADGAVEANSYLDRLTAARTARPLSDFHGR